MGSVSPASVASLRGQQRKSTQEKTAGSPILVSRIRDSLARSCENDRLPLPLVEPQLVHHAVGQPVAPERLHELAAVLAEVGFGQTGLAAGRVLSLTGKGRQGAVL